MTLLYYNSCLIINVWFGGDCMPLRKEEYYYEEEYRIPSYTKPQINNDIKYKPKQTKKVKNKNGKILFGVVIFTLALTMVYRFTLINNLNLEVIKLKSELEEVNTLNAQLKYSAEKNVSLSEIEKYATESLGMQKLQNYQIEYINLDKKDLLTNEESFENKNIVLKVISNIIEFFN